MEINLIEMVANNIGDYWIILLIVFIIGVEIIYYLFMKDSTEKIGWEELIQCKLISIVCCGFIMCLCMLTIAVIDLLLDLGIVFIYIILGLFGVYLYFLLNKIWSDKMVERNNKKSGVKK